ncbi:YveK family protein [Cohnella faecalis]|nr:Wzz/FepE/Etk N-terminal domain-containing protein [Cohnella faecalis]
MEIEMKRYVSALKARLWIVLLIVAAATASAYMYTKNFTPSYYTANTKLIVNKTIEAFGAEQMDFSSIGTSIRLIETYKQIIQTPAIMDKVVEKYPELGLTANQLIGMVNVYAVNETQVMSLSATDSNYVLAARVVNAVSEVFKAEIPKIMKVDNVTILTKAKENEPTRPYGQNLKLNVAVTFAVSLMLSAGLIVLLEYLDNSIKSEEEIWQLVGVPSFAAIPKMKKRDFKRRYSGPTSKSLQAGEQAL